ncbi:phosphoinositide 3-kinase regulatory subunit 4-like [Clavelina lepadiformis]|uniref:phosphoinositide 3-kinase regulatory subunit 4-like n=1 Tax=Clavelina lepadiformis TaxID=159417 RepID=UPI004041BE97
MGNHLAATAPSQIVSVESYLADANDYSYDKSLGSTRFMKVARAKYQEGYTVVKVFVIPDSTVDLESYRAKVESTKTKLKQASNCIPFQRTVITDRAALLVRQYVKYNLYDRISTRPFYNNIERRWVAFQLLCALNQISKFNIWHGDIKSENVLITSWNWLLLADFASYKPVYLPDDNPADFNYFFDTSRRRTCYIAPERFTDNLTHQQMLEMNSAAMHAMDIFSAGCVIAELFTDGMAMFDLAQLLAYRKNKYHRDACLAKIDDLQIRSLVEHMTQLDPSQRFTAEQYLTQWKGRAFPDHFYSFLKLYLGRFCEPPLLSADQTVSQLHLDVDKILRNLVNSEQASDSLVIVGSLLFSSTRQLRYCNGKLKTLQLLVEFAKHLKSDIILERFVPYLMVFIKDNVTRVKARAISALATCLAFVTHVPRGESNIFSEYILPEIGICAQDKAVPVRQAFAENISVFSEQALKFLDSQENTQSLNYMTVNENDRTSYDTQLQLLRDMTQNRVQILLSNPDSTVRQCLLEYSVPRLCAFFGKQKANDVILTHMITFLNDKQDWQLRSSFFNSLVSVAAYIGWQSSHILKPLLQQGLSDSQEFVVAQCLSAISSLVELGLIPKQLMCELVQENVFFLAHPCEWIRHNTVSFICACSKILDTINMHCYILPTVMPFLKYSIVQADKENVLLNALRPFIKQPVYQLVSQTPYIKSTFSALRIRQLQRNNESHLSDNHEEKLDQKVKAVIKKLVLKEMDENDEDLLLFFENFLLKQQRSIADIANKEWQDDHVAEGSVINIAQLGSAFVRRHADMVKEPEQASSNRAKAKKNRKKETTHEMNEEWKAMFGSDTSKLTTAPLTKKSSASNLTISMSQLESNAPQLGYTPPETKQSSLQCKYASCKLDLRALVHHKRDLYKVDVKQRELENNADNSGVNLTTEWQPLGILVAHMKEHRGPIHRIAVSPSNFHFVTVSSDRTLRLWEGIKLEGKAVVNRSKASFQRFAGSVRCAAFVNDEAVVCASDDGTIHSLCVELLGTRSQAEKPESMPTPSSPVLFTHSVNQTVHGRITDLNSIVNSPVIVYSTSHGSVVALDTRMRDNHSAWELKHNLTHGLPTTFCIDPRQHWLCLGTARGVHVCWDLRFQLPITQFSHPSAAGVRKVTTHPTSKSSVISVVTGNNEVSVWNLETGTRQMSLWASTAPPLSLTQKTADSINGLTTTITNNGIRLFTGGTDSKIRLWDLGNADRSRIISGPELSGNRWSYSTSYQNRLVDGTHVVEEQTAKSRHDESHTAGPSQDSTEEKTATENRRRKPGDHVVPTYHHDVITDLAVFRVSQTYLLSSSRDGVVKIWK